MRVAQIMLAKRFGGAERSFVDLTIGLAERGLQVLAIGDPRGEALEKLPRHSNIQCERVKCRGMWDWLCSFRIKQHLVRFAPDLVQTHLARAAHLGGRAAHGAAPTLAKTHNLVNLSYYRYIDSLVATTNEQQTYLLDNGIPATAIVKIPNFCAFEPTAGATRSAGEDLVIKSLGRFVEKKGFDLLLHAFARVLISGVDARLEIAGAGPQGRVLGALAGELELLDKVSFPGWTDDVQSFLSNAHVFVLPSREEPFGIALLEAMACGVPIVSTRTSGPLEVLNEVTALLVDRDDPESLARAITDIARDPHTAARRAREAQRRFSENFDAKTVIDHYLEVYEDLTKQ